MILQNIHEWAVILPTAGPLLGLDIGMARIGLALSDRERMIATPFEVYTRRNMSQDLGHINAFGVKEQVAGIVVGLPLQLDGMEGENCVAVRHFSQKLEKKTGLPVLLYDERMSTAAATRALSEAGMTRKKRQSLDDKLAASLVLQEVLGRLRA